MKSSRTTALSVELLYSCTETSRVDGQRAREEGQVSRVCMSTSMSVSDYKRGSIDSLLLTSTFTTVRVLLSRSSSLCGCFTAVCFQAFAQTALSVVSYHLLWRHLSTCARSWPAPCLFRQRRRCGLRHSNGEMQPTNHYFTANDGSSCKFAKISFSART